MLAHILTVHCVTLRWESSPPRRPQQRADGEDGGFTDTGEQVRCPWWGEHWDGCQDPPAQVSLYCWFKLDKSEERCCSQPLYLLYLLPAPRGWLWMWSGSSQGRRWRRFWTLQLVQSRWGGRRLVSALNYSHVKLWLLYTVFVACLGNRRQSTSVPCRGGPSEMPRLQRKWSGSSRWWTTAWRCRGRRTRSRATCRGWRSSARFILRTAIRTSSTTYPRLQRKEKLFRVVNNQNRIAEFYSNVCVCVCVLQDIRNQRRYRQRRKAELVKLQQTNTALNSKSTFYNVQIDSYNTYIKTCMDNLASRGKWVSPFPRIIICISELITCISYCWLLYFGRWVILECLQAKHPSCIHDWTGAAALQEPNLSNLACSLRSGWWNWQQSRCDLARLTCSHLSCGSRLQTCFYHLLAMFVLRLQLVLILI